MRPLVIFFLWRNRGFPANPKDWKDAVNRVFMVERCREIIAHKRGHCEALTGGFVTVKRLVQQLLRLHCGADVVSIGLLFDCWGDNGRMRYASLVKAVWRRSHHVGWEATGHQTEGTKESSFLRANFRNLMRKRLSYLGTYVANLSGWN